MQLTGHLYAQLSPGDLTYAHSELEGMSNCTQCHTLGEKVSNQKCLDCHSEIESLIEQGRGFHASKDITRMDCFDCHSEHHGRKFEMIRFDEASFDHNLAGYTLEGQHNIIDCRDCHKPDFISDSDLRIRENTFLGLDTDCLSCHDDFHQNTLSEDCLACHNFDAFRPAPKFDHDDARFRLIGQHTQVDCIECHQTTTRNGKDFQEFNELSFNDCVACHDDPHLNHFNNKCASCHNEQTFNSLKTNALFNHNLSGFILKGAHASVACFNCHTADNNPRTVFQDQLGIDQDDCMACHEDVHDGKFGSDCVKCHSEESFFILKDMSLFDHNVTDFPLVGLHNDVDCKSCHTDRYTDDIDFSSCSNCHEDYHNGEFTDDDPSADCIDCHSLEKGFDFTLFTIERHQETRFPLEGAHLATPCFMCHVSEDHWSFRDIGSSCVDCHDDIHQSYIDQKFYPEQRCDICHRSDTWSNVAFDHSLTDWPLEGAHIEVDCRACHFENIGNNLIQTFNSLSTNCTECHENIHDSQFEIDGVTDCTRCHDTYSWFPQNFNHDLTQFPLEGMHAEIACSECHLSTWDGDREIVNYKIESFECIDCHQ